MKKVVQLNDFNKYATRDLCFLTCIAASYVALTVGCNSSGNGSQQQPAGTEAGTSLTGGVGGSTAGSVSVGGGSGGVGGGGGTTTITGGAGGTTPTGGAGSGGGTTGGSGGAVVEAGFDAAVSEGDGATATEASSPQDTSAEPAPSPGCSGGSVRAGNTNETVQSNGQTRVYVLHVPSSYDGTKPFSLLIDLHGGTYDGPRWDTRASNQFKAMAETESFILVSPTATNLMWIADSPESIDGQFIRDMVDALKNDACIDTKRVYATGCSMGGAMSFWLACYASDYIAATAPMCGTAFFELATLCKPQRPVSTMFVMGSQDFLNCWEPPRTSVGNPCASEVLEAFKTINGCTDPAESTHNGVCLTHDQCEDNTEATVCRVNADHMGIYTAPDMNVYEEGWNFLKRFYLRP
ncbi:MAG: hypothetical protein JXA30_12005 [Deltaproteobacteria bacterium]|nr:hypothetical protein [Deltaproteobacteria bacterium]